MDLSSAARPGYRASHWLAIFALAFVAHGALAGPAAAQGGAQGDSWSPSAPLPTPRRLLTAAAAAVALDGKVYVLGGSDGSAASGALEVYDPALNSWSRKAPMPTPRVFLAAAAVNGRIYAIGGAPDCCGNATTNVVEVYDPATDH